MYESIENVLITVDGDDLIITGDYTNQQDSYGDSVRLIVINGGLYHDGDDGQIKCSEFIDAMLDCEYLQFISQFGLTKSTLKKLAGSDEIQCPYLLDAQRVEPKPYHRRVPLSSLIKFKVN